VTDYATRARVVEPGVRSNRLALLRIPPWLIIAAALLTSSLVGRFLASGRITYGLGIVLALVYGPLVFFDLPVAFAVWVAVQFFAELSQLSYGPNAMSVLIGLGWVGAYLGRRAPLTLLRQPRRVLLGILALCLWTTLSIAWAGDATMAATQASYWWMAAFAFVIVLTTITSPKYVFYIAVAFVVGSVISVLIGLATGGLSPASAALTQTAIQGRLTGGGGDPNQQAAGYVAAMFLVVGLFSVYRSRTARAWLMIAFTIVTVGFFATESRGGLVALAAATLVALVVAPRQRRRLLGLAVLVGLASVVLLAAQPSAVHRITDISGGTSGRNDLWRVGWEVFKAHPTVGVGVGNFVVVEPQFARRPGALTRVQYITETPQIVHNTYLQLLAETGVVGLLAFLLVVAGSLWASRLACRRFEAIGRADYSDLTRAVVLGTVGMLAAVFFITDGDDLRLWVLFALGPALLGIATRMQAQHRRAIEPAPRALPEPAAP
jgi:O-antigen ligase